MFNKFTERARKVILLAKQEAKRFNHDYIGTEHVLLGLLREGEGVAAAVLQSLGMNLNNIRIEVEKLVQIGPATVVSGDLPFTQKKKKVMGKHMQESFWKMEKRGINFIAFAWHKEDLKSPVLQSIKKISCLIRLE